MSATEISPACVWRTVRSWPCCTTDHGTSHSLACSQQSVSEIPQSHGYHLRKRLGLSDEQNFWWLSPRQMASPDLIWFDEGSPERTQRSTSTREMCHEKMRKIFENLNARRCPESLRSEKGRCKNLPRFPINHGSAALTDVSEILLY